MACEASFRRNALDQDVVENSDEDERADQVKQQLGFGAAPADATAQLHDAALLSGPEPGGSLAVSISVKPVLAFLAAIGLETDPADHPIELCAMGAVSGALPAFGAIHTVCG